MVINDKDANEDGKTLMDKLIFWSVNYNPRLTLFDGTLYLLSAGDNLLLSVNVAGIHTL